MFARRGQGNDRDMYFVLFLIPFVLLVLFVLLIFPWVGLAMIPVAAAAALVGLAWLVVVLTRGPRGLPEHREPGEQPDAARRRPHPSP
jgi:hypothetical protein